MSQGLVLIVDSDRESASLLVNALSHLPFKVMVAVDQLTAYEASLQYSFDLFLIAHGLADGNGIKLLARLQKSSTGSNGVLIANHIDLRVVYDAVSAGYRHVLPKPLDWRQLCFVLAETFGDLPLDRLSAEGTVFMEYPVSPALPDLEAIASLTTAEICDKMTNTELIRIIRSVDYPFAGKERLEFFDRDTLQRVVCLVRRWSQQRLQNLRQTEGRDSLRATA